MVCAIAVVAVVADVVVVLATQLAAAFVVALAVGVIVEVMSRIPILHVPPGRGEGLQGSAMGRSRAVNRASCLKP